MKEYRVWYSPYDYPDESDFFDIKVESEDEARRIGYAWGMVESVELVKSVELK